MGLMKNFARILYHTSIIILSAAIALSLPFMVNVIEKNFLAYRSFIGNEDLFLISLEIALATLLILLFNYAGRSWKDRKLSKMARSAGLVQHFPARGPLLQRKIRRLKERQGFAREVMVIGSTGFHTLVDPRGCLYPVIKNCREARIMLGNPYGEGVAARAKSLMDPTMTPDSFRDQILKSIDFLKSLRARQKNIKLKLYRTAPFLKLAIIGDYLWIQHYHAGLEVHLMPEYVFRHDQNPGSFYTIFYQHFHIMWSNADIPEYDLDTDELVYRDVAGQEVKREKFAKAESEARTGGSLQSVTRDL